MTASPPNSGSTSPQRWGIVGAGFLGLTLALRLTQAGHRVTVFDAADRLGGLASAWQLGDVTWDRHYHVTLLSDRWVRDLLTELRLDDQLQWRITRTGVYAAGRHHSVSNTLELLRFPALGWIDKLRLGWTIFWGSRIQDGKPLERIPVADWLTKHSGRRAFERFWKPLLRSKLGDQYHDTSAAFIWATIARLYAARRQGLKREMFGYVRGGYAAVLERFGHYLTEQGVDLRLNSPVTSVTQSETAAGTGGRPRLTVRHSGDDVESFDRVAVTAAAPLAARMCTDLSAEERAALERIRYCGIVCASVVLDTPLEGFYVTNLLDEGLPFTGVIEMTTLVDPKELGGHHLVYLPRYLPADDPYLSVDDQVIQDEFLGALERMYPAFRRDAVRAFQVSRVRHVFALTELHYSDLVPPATTSVPGLYTLNSANIVNGTLNVNETIQLAEKSLPELLAPLGSTSTTPPNRRA